MPTPLLSLGLRFAALALSASAVSAQWRSTLYPVNWVPPTTLSFESDKLLQDFSYAGYRRGDVAIPNVSGPIYDVTSYGADSTGAANSTTAIQAAIDAAAAAGGGVVYLPAGTFKISPQGANTYALRISTSNIVLRGAGRGVTFLYNESYAMRSKHIIRVEGSSSGWSTVPGGSPVPTITSDLLSPATVIPVSSVSGLAVGDWIILRADATDAFVAEHNMTDLWAGQGSSLGGVMIQRQITAIDTTNNRLTIDVPTRYYLKTRDNARVHKVVTHVEEVGLENFSIGNREHANSNLTTGWGEDDYNVSGTGAYDSHASFAIGMLRTRNSWVANVATYRAAANTKDTHLLSNGILLDSCRGVTVRDCDLQRALYGGGGGNGYMYRLQRANECLVRDSAARYSRHGFVFSHMATSGNVIHGGMAQVTRFQAAHPGTAGSEGCDHHMHLSQSNLIDGVQLDRDYFTAHYRGTSGTVAHGQTAAHSVFWNLIGIAYYSTKTYIVRSEQARYGYMIGTRGTVTGMSTTASGGTRTLPADHAEGAGIGATLEPLSLYTDQVSRRLGTVPPAAPTGLMATAVSTSEIDLAWNASASATSYNAKRATASGGPYSTIATGIAGLTLRSGGLASNTTYHYVVSATNSGGESPASAEASATTFSATPPPPPTGLNATPGNAQVSLTWNASAGATSYNVKRAAASGGPYATIASPTGNTHTDTTAANGTAYYYVVSAVSGAGESGNSNEASATPTAPAPSFVGSGAISSGTATITPALPSGLATGDILLLFAETANQAVSVSNANGGTWTAVAGSPQSTGTAGSSTATRLTAFWSRYNGTQGNPTLTDSGDHQAGRIVAVRGAASAGDPWDVTSGGIEATADTSGSIPGATTTVANTLVVLAVAASLPDSNTTTNFSGWSNASLTNLTEQTDNSRSSGNGGALGIATGVKATAGAFGATSVTHASSAGKAMLSIAIRN